MTVSQFPVLPGLGWPLLRKEIWQSTIETSTSGKNTGYQEWSYPARQYTLTFNFLRMADAYAEYQQLRGFFNGRGGRAKIWTFNDIMDNTAVLENFGTGDGGTTQFQLTRAYGGFVEPIFAIAGTPIITVDGTPVTLFSLDNYGVVTFQTPPPPGSQCLWSGNFLFYSRFDDDTLEFEQMMSASGGGGGGLQNVKKITFTTEKF